ncbi:MAG: M48 family metalloprotease [Candidatus Eisenbacteria bacterium]|nr:M48 family metalloprotease [Candidatus Latescibacterota bacterium]MBD3301788.1 M48 family metalloprotease [Candidatus Eisenbacteria bacterium]
MLVFPGHACGFRPLSGRLRGMRRFPLILLCGLLAGCAGLRAPAGSADPARGAQGERAREAPPDLRTTARLPSDFLLGLEASLAIGRHFGLVETDSVIRRVNEIGYRVAYPAGRDDLLFTFQVLDVEEPNAMALPGGWLFVTRGILELDLTDAELAHLLGHEITHVTGEHFGRQGRLNSLLSLLQTAAVVMVALHPPDNDPSRPVIEDPGSRRYPQSSAEAALTGTAVLGSLFQELMMRGYSRKLEVEADDGGRRLAALAGYPREAGASLLAKLHDRIYEDRQFGYWRTHPYFTDRVAVARSVARGADRPAPETAVAAYRSRIQSGLAAAAAAFPDERLADHLYELALRAGPGKGTNLAVHSELLGFRVDRILRESRILRPYGPLVADYDTLLAQAKRRDGADPAILRRLARERDQIDSLRIAMLPEVLREIDEPNPSTRILEAFLLNFPEHERADEVRLRLARSYRLSQRHDLAGERLGDLLAGAGEEREKPAGADSSAVLRARVELERTLEHVDDPELCQRLYDRLDDPELRGAALERLRGIVPALGTLELVGRFVQTYPDSPAADLARARLDELARAEYRKARLHEAMGDRNGALGIYNRISILAPGTEHAERSREGIERIQAYAAATSDR